jgi:hypothetical protein
MSVSSSPSAHTYAPLAPAGLQAPHTADSLAWPDCRCSSINGFIAPPFPYSVAPSISTLVLKLHHFHHFHHLHHLHHHLSPSRSIHHHHNITMAAVVVQVARPSIRHFSAHRPRPDSRAARAVALSCMVSGVVLPFVPPALESSRQRNSGSPNSNK